MIIYIGSDHKGFDLKDKLKTHLSITKSVDVVDIGTDSKESCDYPVVVEKISKLLGGQDIGVLICNSGIGMSIAANRFKHIRAALCYNQELAKLSRAHNNANVLVLGAGFIEVSEAISCLEVFLDTSFEGGRHLNRLELIKKLR
jgi:ribose 5-phosphate isomerase B